MKEKEEIFWLESLFEAINLYPWTSVLLCFWILACLSVTFLERETK